MVKDYYNHKERYENWKANISDVGILQLTPKNGQLIIDHVFDMEQGKNTSKKSKNGARSYIRLNVLRQRLIALFKQFEKRGIKDATKLTEKEVSKLFDDMRKGRLNKRDGSQYRATADLVKDFSSFWHWLMKVERKKEKGLNLVDITDDLDTSRSENNFVYLTKAELDKMLPYFSKDEQIMLLFLFDTVMRTGKELGNIKLSDLTFGNPSEVSIREETSKTYGRRIKLLLCSEELKEYVKRKKLNNDDFLFDFSPPYFNRKLKLVATKVFGDKITKGGKKFSEITMYDFRHSGACHWRTGAYRSKIDALMYRGGWSNLTMLNYYTKKIGMKDTIEKEDLLVETDRNAYEKKFESQQKQLDSIKELLIAAATGKAASKKERDEIKSQVELLLQDR